MTLDKKDNANHNPAKDVSRYSSCLYECYYCNEFVPTDERYSYGRHVILSHDGKLAYPSLVDSKTQFKTSRKGMRNLNNLELRE